jgi:hypothetical protein
MTAKLDAWDSTMSREKTLKLLDEAYAELDKGNEAKGFALIQKVPLAPELAMCFATQVGLGPDALKASGFNLKDAEKKYGRDWLESIR